MPTMKEMLERRKRQIEAAEGGQDPNAEPQSQEEKTRAALKELKAKKKKKGGGSLVTRFLGS